MKDHLEHLAKQKYTQEFDLSRKYCLLMLKFAYTYNWKTMSNLILQFCPNFLFFHYFYNKI